MTKANGVRRLFSRQGGWGRNEAEPPANGSGGSPFGSTPGTHLPATLSLPTAAAKNDGRPLRVPGPKGLPLLGNLLDFRRDPLGLMVRAMHAHGDVVRFRLGPMPAYLVCHPDAIEQVLKNHRGYDKQTWASRMIRLVTGDGLLVTNGQVWERQRQHVHAAFTPKRVAQFRNLIVDATQQMLDRWRPLAERKAPVDVASEMMRLTYRIVEKALFGADSADDVHALEDAFTVALAFAYARIDGLFNLPVRIPTPANIRFRRAMQTVHRRVDEIIEAHRRLGGMNDVLSSLLLPGESSKSGPLSAAELRSQTVTLLFAGHETTANALTWLFYLLSQHSEADARVHAESLAAPEGADTGAGDLDSLAYTRMTMHEALRLYTPIWAIVRRATADDVVGGYRLPAASLVVISPYVTHRHVQFWESPEAFDASRFAPERAAAMHPYAYIPFGAGGRYCVGRELAKLEMLTIATMVTHRFRLTLAPGQRVEPAPGITLRARYGMKMLLEPR